MKITEEVIELEMANKGGPPVWDIDVPRMSADKPAEVRTVFARIEKGRIVGPKQEVKLITCLLVAFDPDQPRETRRIGILTPEGHIPSPLAEGAKYLGTFFHPNGWPMSVYDLPVTADETAPQTEGPDVVAALAATADALDTAHEKTSDLVDALVDLTATDTKETP